MKPLLSAIATALILFSAQGVAEQTTQPVVTSCGNVVVVPPSQEQPPFDLNHMGTGSDKSDALGVLNIINELAMIIGNVKTNPSLTAATCFCEFNLIATGTRKRSIPRSNDAINPIFLYLLSWIFIHPNKACMPYPFYDV